jgi:hypothetical protein
VTVLIDLWFCIRIAEERKTGVRVAFIDDLVGTSRRLSSETDLFVNSQLLERHSKILSSRSHFEIAYIIGWIIMIQGLYCDEDFSVPKMGCVCRDVE